MIDSVELREAHHTTTSFTVMWTTDLIISGHGNLTI